MLKKTSLMLINNPFIININIHIHFFLRIYLFINITLILIFIFVFYAPISSHQDQGVDGDVGGDVDDVLDCSAHGETKWPVHENIVTGGGGDTDQDEEEIRHRQVQDQQVGGVPHLGVAADLIFFLIMIFNKILKRKHYSAHLSNFPALILHSKLH